MSKPSDDVASFDIRNATRDEVVGHFADQASIEKWNPGLYDAACHWAFDSNGFFVAVDKSDPQKLVGCILGAKGGDDFGFIGYLIVIPEFRKHGCGTSLIKHAMKYLEGRTIALDAVEAQVQFYQKHGFTRSFVSSRYGCTLGDLLKQSVAYVEQCPDSKVSLDVTVTNENDVHRENVVSKIVAYDELTSPVPREKFIRSWLMATQVQCAVAYDHESKETVGYISIRKSEGGWRINPLFADSSTVASNLLRGLMSSLEDQSFDLSAAVCVDIPQTNEVATQLFKDLQMNKIWDLTRMYHGHDPKFDASRVFGMTAPESQLL